jgi:hypothetical protein
LMLSLRSYYANIKIRRASNGSLPTHIPWFCRSQEGFYWPLL